MFRLVIMIAVLVSPYLSAQEKNDSLEGVHLLYANMLTSENINTIKTGAKSVYRDRIVDIEILDLVAEVMHSSIEDPQERMKRIDLIAWLAKALGQSKNMRYKASVERVANSELRKLQKYGAQSLAQFQGQPVESFIPEVKSLAELKKRYRLHAEPKPNRESLFFSISPNDSLEAVLNTLGMPDSLGSENSKTFRIARHFRSSVSGMVLDYHDLGVIYLNYGLRHKLGWKVDAVSNIYWLMKNETDGDAVMVADYILGDEWVAATDTLNVKASSRKQYSEKLYDIAAEKLYRAMNAQNVYEIKMLTHLAHFIRASGRPRYADIMKEVASSSDSRHIRRHAKKAHKTLAKLKKKAAHDIRSYVPGSLNIGKYLYPSR